jgi:hypothetical protein
MEISVTNIVDYLQSCRVSYTYTLNLPVYVLCIVVHILSYKE